MPVGGFGTAAATSTPASGGGGGTLYPNQPGGYTVLAETDDTKLPSSTANVLHGSITNYGNDGTLALATVGVSPGDSYPVIPACPTGQAKVLSQKLPTGLTPGNGPSAGFYLGQNITLSGANGGPAADEFSGWYQSNWFNIFGNGTNFETVGAQLWKILYNGVTYNNLNGTGGFSQYEYIMNNLTPNNSTNLATDTVFRPAIYTQNFANQDQIQNLNTSFNLHVGLWYQIELLMTMGTDGGANGGVDMWLYDGTTRNHVVSYTNTQVIDHTQANYAGAPATSGFTCYAHSPVWGGGGGNNKSRNDYVLYGHVYVSGTFLRARQ